ncbi:MAG: DUF1902 domain-containing protein [Defluviitaleaceae bacterium]|nr:DUF1902 domain-containing protein [Defluviitaleaceae bacterium]
MEHLIDIKWDDEAGVWCAICDQIPLALESNSFDALIEKAKVVAYEMLEANKKTTSSARLCFKTTHWENIA